LKTGPKIACQLLLTFAGQPLSNWKEDAEQLTEWSSMLGRTLMVHMLPVDEDLILAVHDLHWRVIHTQPEKVVLKVPDLYAAHPCLTLMHMLQPPLRAMLCGHADYFRFYDLNASDPSFTQSGMR